MRKLILFLLNLAISSIALAGQKIAESPNILWIYVDDMSDWIGCYGDNTISTPNIDALAENGVRFNRAYMPCPVCSPTRSALITGTMQTTHGLHHHETMVKKPLPEGITTLPELFREAGYITFNEAKTHYNFSYNTDDLFSPEFERPPISVVNSHLIGHDLSWLKQLQGRKFFGQIQLSGGKWQGEAGSKYPAYSRVSEQQVVVPPQYPDNSVIRNAIARHYEQVVYCDSQVGAIIQALKEYGIWENTVVFFFSDHGCQMPRAKQHVYEEGAKVPLIVHWPEGYKQLLRKGKVRNDLVSGIDISVSSLALAGIKVPAFMEGQNLFDKKYKAREFVVTARDRMGIAIDHVRAIRSSNYLYICNYMTDRPLYQPAYRDGYATFVTLRKLYTEGKLTPLQASYHDASRRLPEELYDVKNDPNQLKRRMFILFILVANNVFSQTASVFVEAESFDNRGGWVIDPQFVEQMGSPYLLAHGLGKPVKDATTEIYVENTGSYHVWVRTKNWAPGNWEAPGRFLVSIDGKKLDNQLGKNPGWNWEYAGDIKLKKGDVKISLHDLTGFEGRCDAIYLTTLENENLPTDGEALKKWRLAQTGTSEIPQKVVKYDLIIVGGGIAGSAASIAAAEQGMKVALVHDRPVLGGNASGEIRVHTLGIYGKFERILKMLDTEHYPNGSADALKEDQKRMANVKKYKNIDLFLNFRAYAAAAENNKITSVDAQNTSSGEQIRFEAPLFVDCTGDGWIGYWAGAEYSYGREAASEYNENWDAHGLLWSPEVPDNFVMGSSVLWGSENAGKPVTFPEVPWAMEVAGSYAEKNGEWQWEFSRNDLSQIDDAETIRDHMFRAIYGSFYNYKNQTAQILNTDQGNFSKTDNKLQQQKADSLQLKWVSYLLGKRESRRLVGDHIFTFNDARDTTKFEDAVVFEKRAVDVHYQINLLDQDNPDFISEAMFYKTGQYSIPYRSLYSKNISNLFMAGRNFSCSHVGLGGPRVMRTTGQMGAAVGLAASVCKKHSANPRDVYTSYLDEYLELIEKQK